MSSGAGALRNSNGRMLDQDQVEFGSDIGDEIRLLLALSENSLFPLLESFPVIGFVALVWVLWVYMCVCLRRLLWGRY